MTHNPQPAVCSAFGRHRAQDALDERLGAFGEHAEKPAFPATSPSARGVQV